MLQELESNFSELERKILKLKKDYQSLQETYLQVSEDLAEMKEKYHVEKKKNQELVEDNKNIKLHATISGNPEHNRLMKNHINRLIKEVDFCIAQLQNSGL